MASNESMCTPPPREPWAQIETFVWELGDAAESYINVRRKYALNYPV